MLIRASSGNTIGYCTREEAVAYFRDDNADGIGWTPEDEHDIAWVPEGDGEIVTCEDIRRAAA